MRASDHFQMINDPDAQQFPAATAFEVPAVLVAAKRGHRRKFGRLPRVMLSGATVDVSTSNLAKRWRGKTLSLGLLLDQVFAFAKRRNFKPNRKKP